MPEKPNRQALRSKKTRDQILDAALAVFSLKGYAAASMDDIRLAAGCSKGGLYHHYPTKSAVLTGVVGRLIVTGALLPAPSWSAGTATGGVAPNGRVLLEIWAEAARDATLRSQLRAAYEAELAAGFGEASLAQPTLAQILRIGTLIQLLARGEHLDTEEAARRLGIERAA